MVRSSSHAMRIASLLVLLMAAPFIPGCSPSDSPLETIVLGEQVTAADDPADDPSSPVQQSFTIDNITVVGSLTQGQACVIGLSCTVSDVDGMVQSVTADFSAAGGPGDVMLNRGGGKLWVWSGAITATVAGSAMIYLTATDDHSADTTRPVNVFVAAGTSGDPKNPPTNPAEPSVPSKEGENIALGRPYTWDVAPNSLYCSDSGDASGLTDGSTATGWSLQPLGSSPAKTSWILELSSSVGWYQSRPVAITIDLGRNANGDAYPIEGLSFYAAGGTGGVDWPAAIDIQVSSDGSTWYHAGDLVELSNAEHGAPPPYGEYTTHCYWTKSLDAHGRYVRLVVGPASEHPCFVVDEIQVLRGPDQTANEPSISAAITDADRKAYVQSRQIRSGIRRRILADAADVQAQARAAGRGDLVASLADIVTQAQNLDGADLYLAAEASYWSAGDPSQFRAILPLNSLHRQVFQAMATLWRGQGRQGVISWQSPLWDSLGLTQTPGTSSPGIDVTMMSNEYRAGSFNLSNADASDQVVNVNVTGLPGGTNPFYVTVQPVPWTDAVLPSVPPNFTESAKPVAAALPVAAPGSNGFLVRVPSGMTTQVWLTFHPTDVPAGTYTGRILVNGQAAGTIRMRVSSLQFPAEPTLSLGGWDSTDLDEPFGATPDCRDKLVTVLREHFVDTPWGTVYSMWPVPVPTDPQQRAQYFGRFDRWVARWQGTPSLPGARHYGIHMSGEAGSFAGHAPGTAAFNTAVGDWIRQWAAHWQELGLSPDQVAILISDEPNEKHGGASLIMAWANAIRAAFAQTEQRPLIWEDPTYLQPDAADVQSLLNVCDMVCSHRPNFIGGSDSFRQVFRQWLTAGQSLSPRRQLNFYSAEGPSRGLDPYSYYRLQAWTCWRENATAMFFWAFADSGGSSWNPYTSSKNYEPLFVDSRTVTGGKHMEAIREGVEDHQYLVMLRDRIAGLKASGKASAKVRQAETLLDGVAGQVLGELDGKSWPGDMFSWSRQTDRGVADRVRIEVLDMLETLE